MSRGDVWWVDFGDPVGSEPGYRRPVVVVSSDRFNASRIATVIVAAITSNLRLAKAPGNIELDQGAAGLTKPSVINVSQILVVNKDRLTDRCGTLGLMTIRRIDNGLRLVLGL